MKNYKKKMADELKASGINVDPPSEFDKAMEEICNKSDAADRDLESLSKEKKEKIDRDKKQAEEMRSQALEKVGDQKEKARRWYCHW